MTKSNSKVLPELCEVDDCQDKARQFCKGANGIAVCNKHSLRWAKYKSFDLPVRASRLIVYKVCSVAGCLGMANRIKHGVCEKHHARIRRNGTSDTVITHKDKYIHSQGYILLHKPGHPLATKFTVYEHRYVYFEKYGNGPFNCYMCNKQVDWSNLHIDHLNDNKTDNRIENLRPACAICNQSRGRDKMADTQRKQGHLLTFNGQTKCLSEWARELKVSKGALDWRIKQGWSVDKVLRPRLSKTGPRSSKYIQDI